MSLGKRSGGLVSITTEMCAGLKEGDLTIEPKRKKAKLTTGVSAKLDHNDICGKVANLDTENEKHGPSDLFVDRSDSKALEVGCGGVPDQKAKTGSTKKDKKECVASCKKEGKIRLEGYSKKQEAFDEKRAAYDNDPCWYADIAHEDDDPDDPYFGAGIRHGNDWDW